MVSADLDLTNIVRTPRGRINLAVVMFFLGLVPVVSHAGGLGMAPLVAIIGGVGWLTVTKWRVKRPNLAVLSLFAFILWAVLTSVWSPYQSDDLLSNPVKLLLGVILFMGSFNAVRAAADYAPKTFFHLFIAINVLMCGLIIIDQLSNFGLTFFFDPMTESENVIRKSSDAVMNVGHSVTVAGIFLGPVIALLLASFRKGLLLSILYGGVFLYASYISSLAAGIMSGVAILGAACLAYKWPRLTLNMAICVAVLSILFAPLLGILCGQLPDSFVEKLPLSWEHRVIMWDYTAGRIWEAPIWGHGFDAVRTFDETISIGGFDKWRVVSLHPHNIGLHIWVETGAIGVFLAVLTLILVRGAVSPIVEHSKYFSVAFSGFIIGTVIICAVSYGVWQEWWWASLIFASSLVNLLVYSYNKQSF